MSELRLVEYNLHQVDVLDATALDPVSLARFDKVLITVPAVKMVEERLV